MKYYNNKITGVTLTKEDYKALVTREAKEVYNEYLESLDEDEKAESFEILLNRMFESDRDFTVVDENGEEITEW